jgi:hypothetical protein
MAGKRLKPVRSEAEDGFGWMHVGAAAYSRPVYKDGVRAVSEPDCSDTQPYRQLTYTFFCFCIKKGSIQKNNLCKTQKFSVKYTKSGHFL